MNRHEWTDEEGRWEAVDDGGDAILWELRPATSLRPGKDPHNAAAREILRLAGEQEAIENELLSLPEGDQDLPLPERVRMAILYAQAGNEYGVPMLTARIKELEAEVEAVHALGAEIEARGDRRERSLSAVVAPLLPLFRERAEAWEARNKRNAAAGSAPLAHPTTITLTAEFPVGALRALTKE